MRQTALAAPLAGESKLDVQRYLRLFQSHTVLCCLLVVTITAAALIVSYVIPKKYEAMSTVSVEQSVISDLVKGIAITPSIGAKLRLLQEHLKSRSLLLNVASALNMDLKHQSPAEREALVASLRERVNVRYDERKGVFYIAFADENPVLARDFVNTMTRLYIEESTASKRQESYDATAFLSEQIHVFQKRIEQAQVAIDTFKSERGMYLGLNEQLLRQQIREREQRLEGFRIRKNELLAKLNVLSPEGRHRETLREKEEVLQSMRASYTEKHPYVRKLQEEIHLLKEAIAHVRENDAQEDFSAEYQGVLVELRSLEESEKAVQAELGQCMQELQALPAIRTELAELEQRKNNETSIYEQLVARFGQSEVSKQMELQDKAVTFRVIDAAVTPTEHTAPRRHLIILAGLALGIALAGGSILLKDLLRAKVHAPSDLKKYELRILAKLPQLSPPDALKLEKRRLAAVCWTLCFLFLMCGVALLEFLKLPYMEKAISSVWHAVALAGGAVFS